MSTELKIKKFKKIFDEITLKNFDFINYFVGENGSGKTSILNGISYLNDGGNSRHFFGPESTVEFKIDEKNQFLYWNESNPNKTEHKGNLNPIIYLLISNTEQEKGANGLKAKAKFDDKIGIGDASSLDKFNEFMEEVGLSPVVAKKFVDQSDPFNQDNGRLIFETDKGTINPLMIADGLKVLFNLKNNLTKWFTELGKSKVTAFIVIEEPENNLHPNLQKEIPVILDNLYKKLDENMTSNIYFFISTHSPFIISSSSKFKNQKVYPLQNGSPLKINFTKHIWQETNISEGYRGAECAYIVSKMLGADITDIGYPENYCILEEYSLQLILDSLRNKGIIKNIQFVSASGASKSLDLADTIYEIEKLNTLIKCNPYYFDKYHLVIDNVKNIKDDKLKLRMEKIKSSLKSRFIELSKHSLEDYYINLDQNISKNALQDIKKEDSENQGKIKAKYAKLISDEINDVEAFSKLFDNELDFLIKNYS